MKTYAPKPADIERGWYVVDADGVVLGRLASEVAKILRGKHKPIYAPHADTGDHVIVVNASGIRLTGGKETKKVYSRHSGYPGGLTQVDYGRLMSERPAVAVERAVRGMLPKNRLGRKMLGKLSVYEGAEHRHQAQKPKPLALGEVPPWTGLPVPAPKPEPKPKAEAPRRRGAAKPAGGKPASRSGSAAGGRAAGARGGTKSATRKSATRKSATRKSSTRSGTSTSARPSTAKSTAKSSAESTAKSTAKASTRTRRTKAASKAEQE
jgi:large subunit ribosomal protein L13